ncbi:hypothetical protein MASR2M48_05120 [Spirochaetota bacterium]
MSVPWATVSAPPTLAKAARLTILPAAVLLTVGIVVRQTHPAATGVVALFKVTVEF